MLDCSLGRKRLNRECRFVGVGENACDLVDTSEEGDNLVRAFANRVHRELPNVDNDIEVHSC